jgi:hypothetical protein
MDLWSVDEVMAWFVEQGLPDYEEPLYKNRVDGFLVRRIALAFSSLLYICNLRSGLYVSSTRGLTRHASSVCGHVQLVHLDNNDWADLGITNRVHVKRLNMLLDPYRIR